VNKTFKDYNVLRMKKILAIVLISVVIVPQGLACSLNSDLCIEWIRGSTDSDLFCVMNSGHNEGSKVEASRQSIKSPMKCCGNMAGTSPNLEFLSNFKRDPQPSVMEFSIPNTPVFSESSSQSKLRYQESWVTTSDPPVKIFKEVNSYII